MNNQSRFQELVRQGFKKIYDETIKELHAVSPLKDKLYTTENSTKAYEEYYGVNGLGDLQKFNGVLQYAENSPGYYTKIEPAQFALGVETEKKFYMNNLYPVLKSQAKALTNSSHRTKEKYAISGYANMNSTAFDFMTSEEGVAIASSSHTTKAPGVATTYGFDNLGTTAFSPTALEATRIIMRGFRNGIGERCNVSPNMLLGPTTLEQRFLETTQTKAGLDTAYQNVNTLAGKYSVLTSDYFNDTSTKNWFLIDTALMKEFAKWVVREEDQLASTVDFETFNMKNSIINYFGYGFTGWQFVYMHQVS